MTFRDLKVYKKGFALAMEIFKISKQFPKEERYSLTDQIRRSSRSVCVTVSEAYRKRLYQPYFISKSSDADMENSETQVWLDFALECEYIDKHTHANLMGESEEIGRLLGHMINNPESYLTTEDKRKIGKQ
ncbi:MAG: four helix bundle protein [Bacteroidetes bacterium]|nr:four helix bundle protein [Bacteroidota bacterium]